MRTLLWWVVDGSFIKRVPVGIVRSQFLVEYELRIWNGPGFDLEHVEVLSRAIDVRTDDCGVAQ